ncbi:hypothetical protein F442_04121 [Phytophthora nicotianae P10297]|uniref:RxLR effector protein n=4 Tax=Phytophthora nicotianae TaxID=4792 RepID=W2QJG9_PHYN3|nr:hypothetical protein PPTG_08171 [Phytophthora nicotianae INRA-310]ETN13292.1 hypothetical protein PPTG_08171 [Phytophthora nicotianae INRA-310]ETP50609.1 hypothetical protein F442_04121 [Phytophthora nicotianae P10297]KUF79404.1 hypothetical protein AM587_10000167 [Phytophthora nicotianae]KUF83821.1 hypothetical protein AM587_10005674 [Phytophthora nicotianae]
MKRFFMFVVLVAAIIAKTGVAMGTHEYKDNKLADNSQQRLLRTTGTTGDDTSAEERGVQTSLFNFLGKTTGNLPIPKKMKFYFWKKGKWDYKRLQEYLFKGVPKEVYEQDPKFAKVLLEYGKYWRRNAINGIQIRR